METAVERSTCTPSKMTLNWEDNCEEIASDPVTYPVLSQSMYPEAYAHLYEIRDSILASGAVYHADDFEWELQIIHDDETLNALPQVATSMSTLG